MSYTKIEQISLRDMIETLMKNKKLILLSIAIFLIIALAYTFLFSKQNVNVTTEVTVKQVEGAESSFSIEPLLNAVIVPSYNASNVQYPDVVTRPQSVDKAPSLDTLTKKFSNELIDDTQLIESIRNISPSYSQVTGASLKSMVTIDIVPDSDMLTIKVSASTKEDATKLATLVNKNFQSYIEKQNFDTINNKLVSIKNQLEFNIGFLETKISRLQKEMDTVDKTVVYQSSLVEPNPAYIMYVQNLSSNKIALNNAQSQYEEIKKVEQKLPQIVKETGLTAKFKEPVIEASSSLYRYLLKNLILAGLVGLVLGGFLAFLREYWQNTKGAEN
ncbi:Wzz/FepE/Etk N-terminal domain-containing protein [Tepidibacillus marianensis]|uniref:Wzz/FepE/Etk N-terminal domain-containing protein n=1 Tax=Tepidibacillus marianensis TaxID=3131995 RepID=UPI0030CE877C